MSEFITIAVLVMLDVFLIGIFIVVWEATIKVKNKRKNKK